MRVPSGKQSNRLSIDRASGCVIKEYLPKRGGIKGLKYRVLGFLERPVPVEYWTPRDRCVFERECLALWSRRGFTVPEVLGCDMGGSDDHKGSRGSTPRLTLRLIEAPTLDGLLRDDSLEMSRKFEVITSVLKEMRERHCLAIYEGEHRLVHYDSNLRNIVIQGTTPLRIDFEMGHLAEKVDRSVAREVKKLSLEILQRLGAASFPTMVDLLVRVYGIRHILRRMADEELNRPLLAFHRRRAARRHAGGISKIDLAEALRSRVGTAREEKPGRAKGDGSEIGLAEGSSWEGKFYQSLDDADPRGRDMPHRYQVMRFPDSFQGKSLLDIGCNLGRVCMDAARRGASRSVGIDHRADVMEAVNSYCGKAGIAAEFYAFDVNGGLEKLRATIPPSKGSEAAGATGPNPQFDYVCALSVWSHVDQARLWEIVNGCCREVFYLEDNAPSRVKSIERVIAILKENLRFQTIEFLGFTTDRGVRAVFRATP